jgi:DNA-binding transcriptional MerR regulator/uncharacterized protein (DUF433 family)
MADAARLLNTPLSKVSRWANPRERLLHRYFDPSERILSFAELMELHFIRMFRDEGVSLQAIRKASQAAAKQFESDYPFSVKRFDTDGKTIFATLISKQTKGHLLENLEKGQYVFGSIVRPFFHKLEYKDFDSTVTRFWPRGKRGRVVLDPNRKFGRPIDAESGVATSAIFDAINAGGGQKPAIVARWLGVPVSAVNAAVAFEQSLAA